VTSPNEDAITFQVTGFSPNSLNAESPTHDFPKKIIYSYFDDTLTAIVSNEEMEIPFIFWRME
jgi:hypothetical protein